MGRTWDNVAQRGSTHAETLRQIRRGTSDRIRDVTKHAIEEGLDWEPGSVDAVLEGGEPIPVRIKVTGYQIKGDGHRGPTGPDGVAELDFEIGMIEKSDLPRGMKNAMIREAQRLRQQQLADQEALQRRQAEERREEIGRWLRIATEGNALT